MTAAARILSALRWGVDDRIVNHDGEEVWLRDAGPTGKGGRFVTDCCFADDPCDHHRALAEAADRKDQLRSAEAS